MKRIIFGVLALCAMLATTTTSHATFIKDTDPGGLKYYIIDANKSVDNFDGHVGANNSGPIVHAQTNNLVDIELVDTGNGYANIKPINNGLLTDLLFTPKDTTKYGDFSFRGQLDVPNNTGVVNIKVINHLDEIFTFAFNTAPDLPGNPNDFKRIGVVSNDGDWFKSVEIWTEEIGGFKEVKQIDFSFQEGTPVPEPGTIILLGAGLLGLAAYGRKRAGK